ncbi:MAG: hypothetical protein V3R99_09785 [Thermoguttaceae bacterium]
MNRYVEIEFDCVPLRSIGRMDVPMDASPKFVEKADRIKRAIEKHGRHNTYYLHKATCTFRLTNDAAVGMLKFRFEGTVLTDAEDQETLGCDLDIQLERDTCDWITEPIVQWFRETVGHAVRVEFDLYIHAGDLKQTIERLEKTEAESDEHGGFLGMGL